MPAASPLVAFARLVFVDVGSSKCGERMMQWRAKVDIYSSSLLVPGQVFTGQGELSSETYGSIRSERRKREREGANTTLLLAVWSYFSATKSRKIQSSWRVCVCVWLRERPAGVGAKVDAKVDAREAPRPLLYLAIRSWKYSFVTLSSSGTGPRLFSRVGNRRSGSTAL